MTMTEKFDLPSSQRPDVAASPRIFYINRTSLYSTTVQITAMNMKSIVVRFVFCVISYVPVVMTGDSFLQRRVGMPFHRAAYRRL